MLPCEFIVNGIPISAQASGTSKRTWQGEVRTAARSAWASTDPTAEAVQLTLVYYYDRDPLDVDNMIKPIQDALIGIIYLDDKQVADVHSHKRDISKPIKVKGISLTIANGFSTGRDFVHINVTKALDEQELIR